jgi:O-antigen/teichoic acid export membrane protein
MSQQPAEVNPLDPTLVTTSSQEQQGQESAPKDLKRRTAHGALISTGAQVASLVLRMGSMMILARLLLKEDFGLVNMVTALTGFLGLFRDVGLSMASVQRQSITTAQTSTLFWVNLVVGGFLATLAAGSAPLLVHFYHEPRLLWITIFLGTGFLFNGATAQHRAMLQRSMRFKALVAIDMASLFMSVALGIGLAAAGQAYWALVAMNVSQPLVSLIGALLATKWIPGKPQRGSGIRSMLWFGGTVTLNNVIVYFAYNLDKVLIGRILGAEVLGVYGRAYQLINLPTENLNSTIGLVAFPALSRIQDDPVRLRSYFLKGYNLFLSIVVPITMGCALFAEDIIRVFLGAKWHEAAGIFRLMSPTIFVFALINPFAWLMLASGRAVRSLNIAFLIAPVVILSYVIGLRYGPHGVAAGFSIAMALLAGPVIAWAKHGTLITTADACKAVARPLVSIALGAAAWWTVSRFLNRINPTFLRLVCESTILFGVYILVMLFGMGQKAVYLAFLRDTGLWKSKVRART